MIVMWLGFALAAYSVVGNDVIQTLGTFLTSNEERVKWWVLWAFAGTILAFTLVNGFYNPFGLETLSSYDLPIAYGRLDKFDMSEFSYEWFYLLPPIVLLLLTRTGVPVSTTFMILTLFSLADIPADLGAMTASIFDQDTKLGGMVIKSFYGYLIAFGGALAIYLIITKLSERYFINHPLKESRRPAWIVAQWCTTGFLWYQWLTQDLANIYIYLKGGAGLSDLGFWISVVILVGLLGYIFYIKGGAVQDIVRKKTNTADIRSATFIDAIYAFLLYFFKEDLFGLWGGKIPMSTTWLFVGLLAGRELGMRIMLEGRIQGKVAKMLGSDLLKIVLGLVVSVILVFIIRLLVG